MNEDFVKLRLLKRILRDYYEKYSLPEVEKLDRREFAFGIGSPKPTVRHKSFDNISQLMEFVRKNVPISIHYSLAIYEAPWEPLMEKKGFLKREVVLDLDVEPESFGFKSYSQLIEFAKEKTLQLLDILRYELGFTNIEIWFSGNRGFHIYLKDKELYELSREELMEIYLYLSLDLVNKEKFLENLLAKKSLLHAKASEPPLFSSAELRLFKELINYIINNYSEYLQLREKKPKSKMYFQKLLQKFAKDPISAIQYLKKDYIRAFFDKAFSRAQIPLDKQLMIDTSHLIRYPGSLNHKLCLLKTKVEEKSLESFNPLEDANPVKDGWVYVTVKRKDLWKYYGYSPPASPLVKIPAKQALVLICANGANYVRGEFYV